MLPLAAPPTSDRPSPTFETPPPTVSPSARLRREFVICSLASFALSATVDPASLARSLAMSIFSPIFSPRFSALLDRRARLTTRSRSSSAFSPTAFAASEVFSLIAPTVSAA